MALYLVLLNTLFLNLFLNILRTFLAYVVLSGVLELFLKFVFEHFKSFS